jgi:hypothetical protein
VYPAIHYPQADHVEHLASSALHQMKDKRPMTPVVSGFSRTSS